MDKITSDIKIFFEKKKRNKCENCKGDMIVYLVKDQLKIKEYFLCLNCAEKMIDHKKGIWIL